MNSSFKFLNFSPNSSKVNTPLAESTAIGSPLAKQYQPQKRKSISPLSTSNISKQQRSGVKIDPQVLTDAQSNGIVSRLVKYYDQSTEQDRGSRIVYNKFGDFPLVHLKKTEIKRPIVRSTSVRIAPPSRAVMNLNARAAIMRSNSLHLTSGFPKIVPTKMRAKDDSHKIITNHEPITDTNYPVSSKSVLDALEKNCRKRIINEELILDQNKKSKSVQQQTTEVDSPSPREFMPILPVTTQTGKRGREELHATDSSTQLSKKLKTRNNALLSSLSSSHYDLLPTISSTIQKNARQSTVKVPAQFRESTVQPTTIDQIKISPMKSTESKVEELKIRDDEEEQPKKLHLFNVIRPDPRCERLRALEKRNLDDDDDDEEEFKINFVKPKERVLQNYEAVSFGQQPDKLNKMLKGLSQGIRSPIKDLQMGGNKSNDTVDSKTLQSNAEKVPAASISFTTSTTSSTIAPISTPASTASAIISINPQTTSTTEKKDGTTEVSTTSTSASNTIVTSSAKSILLPKPSITGGFQFGSTTTAASTTSSEAPKSVTFSTTSSPLVTVSPLNVVGSKPVSPLALFSTPKIDGQQPAAADPNKSLISFTPLKPTEPEKTTQSILALPTSTTSASQSIAPIFGSGTSTASIGFKFGESAATTKAPETKPAFSFGTNTALPSSTTEKSEPKLSTGFNFGASASNIPSIVPATTSAPSFSFGSSIPKLSATPQLASSAPQPLLGFQNPVSTAATTTASSNNMFSFGTTVNTVIATPAASTNPSSVFGITSPTIPANTAFSSKPETTTASGIGFSFGGSTGSTANKPAGGFSFGGAQQQPSSAIPATTAPPAFSFGSTQAPATTQSSGIFPSIPATTAAPAFSFGGNSATPSFGSVQKTEASTPSGMFSFGQKPQTAPVATTANSTFGFGAQAPNTNALSAQPSGGFSFGGSAQNNSSNISNNNNNNNNSKPGIFSRLGDKQPESKPFSFGGSNQTNLQPSATVPLFGGSSTSMQSTTSAPTIFGSATSTTSSVFGQAPTLGNSGGNLFAASNNNSTTNNQQASSPFGGASTQPSTGSNNLFAFNSSTNNNNNNNNQPQQTGIFGFNSNNTPSTNTPQNPISSSSSIFGSSNNNNNNTGQNVSASFTFKTASAANPQSPFGQNAAPPAYQFGPGSNNNSANNSNNVSASFTFSGGASAPVQSNPPSAPIFNFGNAAPSLSANPGGAFNFQGQQPTTALPQPSPVNQGGLFNIGTGGTQQRRPTRVAARRYK